MRLFLARHGNTFEASDVCTYVGKRTDLSLVKTGHEQAKALGEFFKANGITPDVLYIGGLKRQKETAQEIIDVLSYEGPVYPDTEALTEIDYGLWEGKSAEEINREWPNEYKAWCDSCIFPEGILGGTYEEYKRAIQKWLKMLSTRHTPTDTILGISSGGIIRYFRSLLWAEWKRLQEEKRIAEVKVKTGHFCELDYDGERLSVVRWNQNPVAFFATSLKGSPRE